MTRKAGFRAIAVALSTSVLAGCSFLTGWPVRRTYQAYVALSGQEPFGPINAPSADPPDIVVLYRTGRDGVTCYDAFYSEELHKALLPKDGKQVTVVYDTFSDFGKVRGYNVHSVDGIILANGYHVLKPQFAAIAGVARLGPGTASGDACW